MELNKYFFFRLRDQLLSPFWVLKNLLIDMWNGKLFPIDLRYYITCGPRDEILEYGNGREWLTLTIFIVTIVIIAATNKPKSIFLKMLVIYIAVLVSWKLSYKIFPTGDIYCG